MFNPSRDQARQFFFDSWKKGQSGEILTPLETLAVDIIREHPEYHSLLDDPEKNLSREFFPEEGKINPFLHLSLHLAVAEQLPIDQPPGIRERYLKLQKKRESNHEALHDLIECLGEMVWLAQKNRTPPEAKIYLSCLDAKLNRP